LIVQPEALAPTVTGTPHRLEAFGLAVDSDWPLPGSRPAAPGALGGVPTRVRRLSPESFLAEWGKPSEPIFQPKYPDGRTRVVITRSESHYLLWFDVYGRFIVRIDGSEVACEADAPRAPQERILFAQLLPLAAVLRGFEVLHGSAVVVGSGVAVFMGPAGIGKTTLASRLVLRGAELVTDDVLALERTEDGPIAHPGPPMMVVSPEDGIPSNAGRRLGSSLGQTDKIHVSVPTVGRALPLTALHYLEPGESFAVTALEGPDVRQLLGSVFVPYLTTPGRLQRHLDMAQLLGDTVSQFRLQIPRSTSVEDFVESVEAHLEERVSRC
jgi:hypothetical protein